MNDTDRISGTIADLKTIAILVENSSLITSAHAILEAVEFNPEIVAQIRKELEKYHNDIESIMNALIVETK